MALTQRINNCLSGKTLKAAASINRMQSCDVSEDSTATIHKMIRRRPTSSTGFLRLRKISHSAVLSNAGTRTSIRRKTKQAPPQHSKSTTAQSLQSSRKGVKVRLSSLGTDLRLLTLLSSQVTSVVCSTTLTQDLSKPWPLRKLPRLQSSANMSKG